MDNLSIAQAATLRPITEIAHQAGLSESDYEPLGRFKAKLSWEGVRRLQAQSAAGKLVLVTALTPTQFGEGKTTVTVGLTQGLNHIGRRAIPALREPALGPVLGNKGGACGGGYSQVLPMEDINLFFTGDLPAITAAHNLLSALLDAHLHHGNALDIDPRFPTWPRAVDLPDRALRQIVVALGGTANGYVREDGFVITPASEVMAILCLSRSLEELHARLGRIVAAVTRGRKPITAQDLQADGAMSALLRDALRPNLVQTLEGGPALVHGGPFANIAHGTSTLVSMESALGMAEFAIVEAGFASDLGAEKFMHIVAPELGRGPDAVVLVVTVRAVRHHGGGDLVAGFENVRRHLGHLRQYGRPVVVAINQFGNDSPEDLAEIEALCVAEGVAVARANGFAEGGAGCAELARRVAEAAETPSTFSPLITPEMTVEQKLETIVTRVYGGDGFTLAEPAQRRLDWVRKHGLGEPPVCVAKTQYSLADDPAKGAAPQGFRLNVREIRPCVGAGFVVAVAGEIMLMPGLGKTPGAHQIRLDERGQIQGMF